MWIAGLMKQREEILLKERAFSEKKYFDEAIRIFFLTIKISKDKKNKEKV